jgi:hypothetical protein
MNTSQYVRNKKKTYRIFAGKPLGKLRQRLREVLKLSLVKYIMKISNALKCIRIVLKKSFRFSNTYCLINFLAI